MTYSLTPISWLYEDIALLLHTLKADTVVFMQVTKTHI